MARATDLSAHGAPVRDPDGMSQRGALTHELVLSTSTELFAERGFSATTMRQLADRAGLPLSSFYYYYRRKYDVLLAIMDSAMGRLEAGACEVLELDLAADLLLPALVERHVQVHLTRPAAARVADGELRSLQPSDLPAMLARRDRYERIFRDVLSQGARAGVFARGLDIPMASAAILTMSTGVIDWWRPGGRHTIEATAQVFGRFALGMALASGGTDGN
jgi:AcrR family transcriptional regulator